MMRKRDVDEFARKRPFQPFRRKLVHGPRHRFHPPEEFLVARDPVVTVDRRARTVFIGIGRISTIGRVTGSGPRKPCAR